MYSNGPEGFAFSTGENWILKIPVDHFLTLGGNGFGAGRNLLSVLCSSGGAFSGEHKTEWLEDFSTSLQMFPGGERAMTAVKFDNTILIGYWDLLVNMGKFTQKCKSVSPV